MEKYGFKEVNIESFEDIYKRILPSKEMTDGEKRLFLNKTFIFQKVQEVIALVKLPHI
jgi:translation initiation factor 2 beta subunit (eIF-2beta)/eIF-5